MNNSEDYSKLNMDFGKRVRELRKEKKISTIEMSRRCFIDSGNYVRIEQGKTNPTLRTIYKICVALEITLSELFSTL
ncbi:helix-turn-helix transcriptional regulator [Fulvivirga sp. M361]|uniref:helix-turn-helix domain-containing protein n=1 Tax=Fulvivirga sp. M361 TaxID=2594266 RepID=UPI00117A4A04|nr:helix-turn-helix transcriptional regulator [Fulvivirga sp. M361]TRX58657.1 helix-turn-helix transcriptional regulator [Fulvivirga sp. M361]